MKENYSACSSKSSESKSKVKYCTHQLGNVSLSKINGNVLSLLTCSDTIPDRGNPGRKIRGDSRGIRLRTYFRVKIVMTCELK